MTAPSVEVRARRSAVIEDRSRQGRVLCRALSDVTDEWLRSVYATAVETGAGAPVAPGSRMALVAVGGYGRGELAPGSDLDLWLLHDGGLDAPALKTLAERLWYPVWDAGLKLGHAVLTPRQALALAAKELDTATAALSVRHLAGDEALAADLKGRATALWRKRSSRFLAELSARVSQRHVRADEVAFLLEPDIKEARGGLRDIHALAWAEAARPVLLAGDAAALAGAEEVLLAVRVELHRTTGRSSDELLLERQDEVASALGDPGADALMGRVAAAARTVSWTGDEVWHRLASSLAGPLGRLSRRDRSLGPGLVLRDAEVHVEADASIEGDLSLVLRAAAAAATAGVPIDRPSLERLGAQVPVLDGPWPEGTRTALVELLATGRRAIPVLEALDQRGLVHRVLPEWEPNRSRPQRNAYHRFTVDRHLCETAANAAALTSGVARPDLLLVGAWLHDLGKGYPGDHTEVGMELLASVGPRMGFDGTDVATLIDLVRHHLLLPDVATRRDLADPVTTQAVADAVGSLEVLELLHALAEADAAATGPAAWSSWKAELIADLVRRTAALLAGASPPAPAPLAPWQEQLLAEGGLRMGAREDEVTVVAPDRPGLLAVVAGTLALHRLDVLSASVFPREAMSVTVFRVAPRFGSLPDWALVQGDLRRALEGELNLAAVLATREAAYAPRAGLPRAPAQVRIVDDASDRATIVEVHAADAIGVLTRIAGALAAAGLDVRTAHISTLGTDVVDSFYVVGPDGAALSAPDLRERVEQEVLAALG